MVDYHVNHGGISRYEKWQHFCREILRGRHGMVSPQSLAERYAAAVVDRLMECPVADGIELFRKATSEAAWMVVSGGDENELKTVFSRRSLSQYFDAGIFGSPESKDAILGKVSLNGLLRSPALFLGDSLYDYESATRHGIDFVFLSRWTEMPGWREFVARESVLSALDIADAMRVLS